jgi:hypothetical protein
MWWRPGASSAWHWLADVEAMLIDWLVWLGLVAVAVVGALAIAAMFASDQD